ncbi:methylmalonyl-CoA epimerase [Kurthia zopfii]|uniref:Lactoylglutathione lyase n=1 Tax=Kurthia zopfii TaxID=1650 RepID=A0A2U3ABN1_9BACL|nr:methylmalonyl-CoA epimerase [Kurthia zopfii]PWI21949.1 methylmalonyl-CoA epimerase [Kurthia zopfii]TDR36618.1 methylmalonyl-CoA epimerase [Kurthia zopfii]STX09952.1 Lactoylglutathione lyase [Kurthia zopfii]VEI07463.1 Lactoylglutathione lyase [Kurthia zopfii]GEK30973.1 methylmalonyl-CoA epimerase [Kurthia zopfii]
MENVDHIGIAVKDLDARITYYTNVLGMKLLNVEEVQSEQVRVAFLDGGNTHIELLEPLSEESAIYKHIEKRGEGIHHIALNVIGIEAEMERMASEGARLLSDQPKPGAGGAKVAFVHPKSSFGVLYELVDRS